MLEYKPWAKNELDSIVSNSNKELPVLDIQLGGACNLNCIYCDTPKYGYPCTVDIKSIERLIKEGKIKWVYICGLGEPTAGDNLDRLKKILQLCSSNGIGCSMFSNIVHLDDNILNYISNGTLNILFKLDSFNKDTINYLYGQDKGDIIVKNIAKLEEVIRCNQGTTNLGASIVPTSVNYDELPKIIDYCMEKGIFPFIGQLEEAGKCSPIYKKLEVKKDELVKLKLYIQNTYNVDYKIPMCPATISSVHVTNTNKVISDDRTGLSCPWFWLDEPKLKEIGDIRNMNYDEIVKAIMSYRKSKFEDVKQMEQNISSYPFGGCGGDAKQLLKTYISINK